MTAGDPLCLDCGKVATADKTCDGGDPDAGPGTRDHYVGVSHSLGCASCGRLTEACVKRPCQARDAARRMGWR